MRFAWNVHGPNDTLDPVLLGGALEYLRGRAYYNGLVRFNDDLSLSPELAEEWNANANATEWTFKLRRGVEFHDGKTMTADDVVYSMNRHLGEDSVSRAKTLVTSVTEWKKLDDYTVRAVLSSPNADLPSALGTFHFKVVQSGATDFLNPKGTGPFKVREFKPGIRSLGVRNENYWVSGRPYVDELETFAVTDNVARTNALLSGEVDMIAPLDPKAVAQVEAASNLEVVSVPSGSYFSVVCMLDRAPGNNPDFVMGLKLLQRRERTVRSVLKGHGTLANDQPIGPSYFEHCTELEQRAFDPEKAEFHLRKSGVTEATIQMAEVYPGITDVCLLLQQDAQKTGLKLNLNRVPVDGYWGTVYINSPMFVTGGNMRPTANAMLSLVWHSGASWNETAWKNERFDRLLVETRSELDRGKRHEMYCEMQRMLNEKDGHLIPAHRNYLDAKHKAVKGLTAVPLSNAGGVEWPESVWIDA